MPTRHLVIGGPYRHLRNPMYIGVASAILGQAHCFGDTRLLIHSAFVALAFHLFVLLKRTLAEYETFRRNVPRWIPRLTPWDGDQRG